MSIQIDKAGNVIVNKYGRAMWTGFVLFHNSLYSGCARVKKRNINYIYEVEVFGEPLLLSVNPGELTYDQFVEATGWKA